MSIKMYKRVHLLIVIAVVLKIQGKLFPYVYQHTNPCEKSHFIFYPLPTSVVTTAKALQYGTSSPCFFAFTCGHYCCSR